MNIPLLIDSRSPISTDAHPLDPARLYTVNLTGSEIAAIRRLANPEPVARDNGPWQVWGEPGEKEIAIGREAGGVSICQISTTDGEGKFTEQTAARADANARHIAALPETEKHLRAVFDALHSFAEDASHISGWLRDLTATPEKRLEMVAHWIEKNREQRRAALVAARPFLPTLFPEYE